MKLGQNNAVIHNLRAVAFLARREYDRAIADCDEAIRLDPKTGLFYANRGLARFEKGAFEQAVADFAEALARGSEPAAAIYRLRGIASAELEQWEQAADDLQAAVQRDPLDASAWVMQTCLYL